MLRDFMLMRPDCSKYSLSSEILQNTPFALTVLDIVNIVTVIRYDQHTYT